MGVVTLGPIWDDPAIQEITPGEIECCARCLHLARAHPEDFGTFKRLRFVHFAWRNFHLTWREGDPVE